MHLYLHKKRHVVVLENEKPEDGNVVVSWVALSPSVGGVAKRGRRPDYAKPVPVVDLSPLDDSDVTDDVRELAMKVLSKSEAVESPLGVGAESETGE